MKEKTNIYLSLLTGSVLLLLLANLGLFYRMNQLQSFILKSLEPFQMPLGLENGEKAPDFNIASINRNATVSLSEFKEQPILLVFSSTSCPACKDFWPILREFQVSHPDLEIIMISQGTIAENIEMVKSQGFEFSVLLWEDELVKEYKVPGTPYLYVIQDGQKVVFSGYANQLGQIESVVSSLESE